MVAIAPAMPSMLHEALVLLFRNRPSLGPELARDALHAPLPPFAEARVAEAALTDVKPAEYDADLVVDLVSEGAITAALVIEVQLGPDPDKRWTWPAYLANLRRRLQRDALLLVVATDATVASWAEAPIAMGQPRWVLRPLVLGPSAVPIVTDPAEAARAPELAVVSVLAHRLEPCVVEIARASLEASRALDDERSRLYVDLVFAALPEAAPAALEALMASGTYEYQSGFAKRYVAQGEAKGDATPSRRR